MSDFKDDIMNAISWHAKAAADKEFPFRHHLGASLLGHSCERYLFFVFRWVQYPDHSSRILRIFDRGRKEEDNIIAKLREIGLTITNDDGHGKQLRAQGLPAHVGGSLDGILHVPANYAPMYGNIMPLEIKTHKHSSWQKTFKRDLRDTNPQHYTQGNIYGYSWGVTHFLYVGLDKDTDELGVQFAEVDNASAKLNIHRGKLIVYSQDVKLVSKTQEKWRCKMCDFKDICSKNKPASAKNCRSCVHATPLEDGTWLCNKRFDIIEKFSEIDRAADCTEWTSII